MDKNGQIRLSDLQSALTDETILVSIMHVNNEVGAIQPIKEIGQLLAKYPESIFPCRLCSRGRKVPLDFHKVMWILQQFLVINFMV